MLRFTSVPPRFWDKFKNVSILFNLNAAPPFQSESSFPKIVAKWVIPGLGLEHLVAFEWHVITARVARQLGIKGMLFNLPPYVPI